MWTLDLIRELADETGDPLASIYLPTHTAGREIQQDPIRLKNAVRALEKEAEERGFDEAGIGELMSHPKKLIDDAEFWRYQSHGLALFCRRSGMRILKLPFSPTEFRRLGKRFHIAPLIRAAGGLPVFHLLAVNRDGSTLYDIAGEDVAVRPIDPMLDSLDAARGMSDYDALAGFHADHAGSRRNDGGEATARYHSLGTGTDEQEEIELERYVASIARAVGAAIAGSEAPLVLAGGDRIVGRIRTMLKGPHLCEGTVDRNTTSASVEDLAEAAREIVVRETGSPRDGAFERLKARLASGDNGASADSSELVKAATEGRIDVAFLDLQSAPEGSEPDPERAKLVDEIAVETIRHGGTVYAMPEGDSDLSPAAALFRF